MAYHSWYHYNNIDYLMIKQHTWICMHLYIYRPIVDRKIDGQCLEVPGVTFLKDRLSENSVSYHDS